MDMDLQASFSEPILSLPTKIKTGVLYKDVPVLDGIANPITGEVITNKQAIYLIEHVIDPNSFDVAIVYSVQAKSDPPVKAFESKKAVVPYRQSTTLGSLAQTKGIKQERSYIEEKPPLFVTPIIEGLDTFTGEPCLGFLEREPDKFTASGSVLEGKSTNVFVSLDSIEWLDTRVPTRDLIADVVAIKDVWFNL